MTLHHNVFDNSYRRYTSFFQRLFHDFILKPNIISTLKRADKKIAVSDFTKKSFSKSFGVRDILVIHNFIDTDKFKPDQLIHKNRSLQLLFVGNLTKRKGADLLPLIMSKVGSDVSLRYTTGLRSKIPHSFRLPNMIPLGKLTEESLLKEYNDCDALLFPTRFEGFGYTVAEAMACGKPVISSHSSSIPEIVQNGENGYLSSVNNVNEIVENIKLLQSNKNLNKKFIYKNRSKIIEKFGIQQILKHYENLYS